VAEEFRAGGSPETVVESPATPAAIQSWDLGDGEASVLAWASAKHTENRMSEKTLVKVLSKFGGCRLRPALGFGDIVLVPLSLTKA